MATLKRKTNNGYEPLPAMVVRKTNAENGNGIGTCSTSSGTALTVSLTDYELVQNGFVAVTFSNDVPANATLNVNGKGAKPIYYKGSAIEADVIKADDTVTFGYDGTNYVVTSLGGGGGSVDIVEYLSINLTCDEQAQASGLVGATVVVTDDDNSETILSTTWQGTTLTCTIDVGINYTITVGAVTDYITPSSKSFKARAGYTRTETFEYFNAYWVNLGLPSGTLWARGNIISDGNNGYKIGDETDYGAYVSWGNVTPHFSSNGSTFDDGFVFTEAAYNSSPGASVTSGSYPNTGAVYAPNSGYDAARQLLGSPWRMPTTTEFQELIDNCTSVWTTKNGVVGREFTSNINGAKIFFPAAGKGDGASLYDFHKWGYYYSSSLYSANDAYFMYFNSNGVANDGTWLPRRQGFSVRAVQ